MQNDTESIINVAVGPESIAFGGIVGDSFDFDFDVRQFGAVGNGVADDTTAIANAWAAVEANGGVLNFPAGKFVISVAQDWNVTGTTPKGVEVRGAPGGGTKILPTSAVVGHCLELSTEANNDGTTNSLLVSGFYIDGVSTSGKTGIIVGGNIGEANANITLRNMWVMRFVGAGGIGIDIRDAVDCTYDQVYVGRCHTNWRTLGTIFSMPTSQFMNGCKAREATTYGFHLDQGYGIQWNGGVIESNGGEGVYCVPSGITKNVIACSFGGGVWFENNKPGGSNYQVLADGSAAGSLQLSIGKAYFSSTSKSISMKSVISLILNDLFLPDIAGGVLLQSGCRGSIMNWPENNSPIASVLINSSGGGVDVK